MDLPSVVKDWSLRSLRVKLIKIGARIVRDDENGGDGGAPR